MKAGKIIKITVLIILALVLVISGYRLITTLGRLSDEKEHTQELAKAEAQGENLFEKNSDMICWIDIEGTEISYPVMYTPDEPEYYLHRDFDGEYSYSGLPFLDSRCDIDNSSNLIIYGHNMKNSTMFSQLLKYEDYDFWKEHRYINVKTADSRRKYEIIAAYRSEVQPEGGSGFRYYGFTDTDKASEYDEYLRGIKSLALYDTGASAKYGTQLMTLSTCSYHTDDGRFAVTARRIE